MTTADDPARERDDHLLAGVVSTVGEPVAAQVSTDVGCSVMNDCESPRLTLLTARDGHGDLGASGDRPWAVWSPPSMIRDIRGGNRRNMSRRQPWR